MIEKISHDNTLLAIIIRSSFSEEGVQFVTPEDFSQQLAYICHPEGKTIQPHFHNPVTREVFYTQEVLFVRKGKLRVDFYDTGHSYLKSRILQTGDVVLLASGGHGFEMLEKTEIVEVKQGPYAGEQDKTRFEGVSKGYLYEDE